MLMTEKRVREIIYEELRKEIRMCIIKELGRFQGLYYEALYDKDMEGRPIPEVHKKIAQRFVRGEKANLSGGSGYGDPSKNH